MHGHISWQVNELDSPRRNSECMTIPVAAFRKPCEGVMRRIAASTCSSWRAGCSWGLLCKQTQPEILQRSLNTCCRAEAATRARPRPAPRPASTAVQGTSDQLTHHTDESFLQPHQQEQQWTPVVDKPSGLTYFWNEQTGAMPFNASLHLTREALESTVCVSQGRPQRWESRCRVQKADGLLACSHHSCSPRQEAQAVS